MSDREPDEIELLRVALQQSRGRFSFIEVEIDDDAKDDFVRVVDHWRFDPSLPFALITRLDDTPVADVERLAHGTLPASGALIVFGERLLFPLEREQVLSALNVARDRLVQQRRGPLVLVVRRGQVDLLAQYAPDLHSIRVGQFSIDATTAHTHAASLRQLSEEERYAAFRLRVLDGPREDRETAFIATSGVLAEQVNDALTGAAVDRARRADTLRHRIDDLRSLSPFEEQWTAQYFVSMRAYVDELVTTTDGAPASSFEAVIQYFAERDAWFEASVCALSQHSRLVRIDEAAAARFERTVLFECVAKARLLHEWARCWEDIVQYDTRRFGPEIAWREIRPLLDRAESFPWTAGREIAYVISARTALHAQRPKEALSIARDRWLPLIRAIPAYGSREAPLKVIALAGFTEGSGGSLLEAERALLEVLDLYRVAGSLGAVPEDVRDLYRRVRRTMGKSTALPSGADAA